MIEYKVKVWSNGNKEWYLHGRRHREDGPAVECVSGYKEWWLRGEELAEDEFNNRIDECSKCNKVVTIDGVDYQLVEVKT